MLKDAKDSTARYKEAHLNEPRKSEKEKEKRKKENKKVRVHKFTSSYMI